MSDATFREVPVILLGGETGKARATGNNATWMCVCGEDEFPMLATWFPEQSESVCPTCGRRYKFVKAEETVRELAGR